MLLPSTVQGIETGCSLRERRRVAIFDPSIFLFSHLELAPFFFWLTLPPPSIRDENLLLGFVKIRVRGFVD